MLKQTLDHAITTAELCRDLNHDLCHDEAKSTARDLLFSAGQVCTALGVCWMVHCFV